MIFALIVLKASINVQKSEKPDKKKLKEKNLRQALCF